MKKLKHILGILCICLLTSLAVPVLVFGAQETISADGNWDILADYNKDTCTVIGWNGASSTLAIPSKIDGLTVREIDFGYQNSGNRIENRKMITAISIPSTVRTLGGQCFYDLPNLKTAEIPSTVKNFGGDLFSHCTSLTKFTIPKTMTEIPESMFLDCTSLSKVTFHSGITKIGDSAFGGCTSLKSISLPPRLKSIGCVAFTESGLRSLSIPDTVREMQSSAFSSCTNLASVKLPAGMTEIPMYAFLGCTALRYIAVPSNYKTISYGAFEGCKNLTTVVFRSNVDIDSTFTAIEPTALLTIYAPSTASNVKSYCSNEGIRFRTLNPPTITSKKRTTTTMTMKWKAVSQAVGYRVYRKTGAGSYKLLKTTTSTSFKDTGLKKGVSYYYRVYTLKKAALGNMLLSMSSPTYKTYLKK